MEKEFHRHMLLSLLFLLFFISLSSFLSAFDPSTALFILCGSESNQTVDGRAFVRDSDSNSLTLSEGFQTSIKDLISSSDSSPLYLTSRIFTGTSYYDFDIERQGPHVVRLHFYPFYHQKYNLTSAIFDVSALGFTLLKNFSIRNRTHVLKEYIINIDKSKLQISFNPLGQPGLAFVNAIEVFSAPGKLFNGTASLVTSTGTQHYGFSTQLLETFYRINVGGPKISPVDDALWRTWEPDDEYLFLKGAGDPVNYTTRIEFSSVGLSPEVAPERVYNTARITRGLFMVAQDFNITWNFSVTKGFRHLVRMHFCDIVTEKNSRLDFNIYIQGCLATEDFHPSPPAAPRYLDFVAAPDSLGLVRVSLGPSTTNNTIAMLNGLEILRINDSRSKKKPKISVGLGVGIGLIALVVTFSSMANVVWTVIKRPRREEPGSSEKEKFLFSFKELELATNNFDESSIVGKGGFGNVFKGELRDGTKIAVKRRLSEKSQQGSPEFETEIYFLSKIRHQNLVSLIGYCNERSEMILIYEYLENGPLKKHLYGSDLPCLSWIQRLKICIGAARGLHYLHTGFTHGIIHRDLNSANILLNEDYSAKVADFGLSKLVPSADSTHVTTTVKGTFGYIDPEYFRSSQLTLKSDVYSFGVVLLEVLCAQPVIDHSLLSRETVALVEWAMHKKASMSLEEIIDPRIAGEVSRDCLMMYWETMEKCLNDYGAERPSVSTVLHNLECVLELQQAVSSVISLPNIQQQAHSRDEQISDDSVTGSTSNPSERTSSQPFSQSTVEDGHPFEGSGNEKHQ